MGDDEYGSDGVSGVPGLGFRSGGLGGVGFEGDPSPDPPPDPPPPDPPPHLFTSGVVPFGNVCDVPFVQYNRLEQFL